MAGGKYYCTVCGCKKYLARSILCCDVQMKKDTSKSEWNKQKVCQICGKEFVTTSNVQKYCSEGCKIIGKRRRDKINDPRRNKEHVSRRPYAWLEQDVLEYRAQKRKIIDVLSREYPWVDVLAGNAPAWSANY